MVEEEPEPAHQTVRGLGHVTRELPVQADPVRAPVHLIITPDNRPSRCLSRSMDNIKKFSGQKKIINNLSTCEIFKKRFPVIHGYEGDSC